MLRNHYFSHWDTQGYKPYVRYTIAGGQGSVSENCVHMQGSLITDPMDVIRTLEYDVMYNDASSGWRHRDNILNPFHNKVSIGIAYDSNDLYLVQDFEDDYVAWSNLTISNNNVVMKGTIMKSGLTISDVAIYHDKVTNLTAQQLAHPPYIGSYDAGTYVGMAVASGWKSAEGITITAKMWSQTGQNFEVNFDLSPAFAQYGKGVYTLYLSTNMNSSLTSYSVWNLG